VSYPGTIAAELPWEVLFGPGNRLLDVPPSRQGIVRSVALGFFSFFEHVDSHDDDSPTAGSGDGLAQHFHATNLSFRRRQRFLAG
jgi:hypothetical protein